MQTWQYKVTAYKAKKLLKDDKRLDAVSEALNSLGEDGWELVNFAPFSRTQGLDLGGSTEGYTFVFKRLVEQEPR